MKKLIIITFLSLIWIITIAQEKYVMKQTSSNQLKQKTYRSVVENSNVQYQTLVDRSGFVYEVELKLDQKLGSFQSKDEAFIKEIGDIKGDIKVILERTSNGRNSDNNINNAQSNKPPGKTN